MTRALEPLRLGSIRPAGWLAAQLHRQLVGPGGTLDDFWPDVRDNAWIGGDADGWERGPYWLDAMVPLAFGTGDAALQDTVRRWVDAILARQSPDGWMGPASGDPDGAHHAAFGDLDVWPRAVVAKALLQFESATGDPRIIPALLRLFRRIADVIAIAPLHEWGRARWADLGFAVVEVHRRTGEAWLEELIAELHRQGLPWSALANDFPFTERVDKARLLEHQATAGGIWMNDEFLATHGVNVAMGLKAVALDAVLGLPGGGNHLPAALLATLDEHHGQATGVFSCDEHLAGRHPSQGTETCTVVELLYSLELTLEALGLDEDLLLRLERVAFNALPASALPDDSAHQYDQQANQVRIGVVPEPIYTNNGGDANVFGFAPHFACCTANRHQGWPKLASRLWMRSADGGLAALSYAPCLVTTEMAGVPVTLEVGGGYPFTDEVTVTVTSDAPVEGTLHLRIPRWAREARIEISGAGEQAVTPEPGTVHTIQRTWSGTTVIHLAWSPTVQTEVRQNSAVALVRGPIVLVGEVSGTWTQIGEQHGWPSWAAESNAPWTWSLDRSGIEGVEVTLDSTTDNPFDPRTPGARAQMPARLALNWTLEHGAAGAPPSSPVSSEVWGAESVVELRPYGTARLRVTEFPWWR